MCGSKKSSAPAQPTPTIAQPAADPRRAGAAAQAASIQAAQDQEAQQKAAAAAGTEQRLGDQAATGIGALLTG